MGAGFLMLAPLLLFIIHIREVSRDFAFLKTFYSKRNLIGIAVFSFCVIPFFLTLSYLNDKRVLNETLDYLYSPDYSKSYDLNKVLLQKTLSTIKKQKKKSHDIFWDRQQPYLSSYFNWLVLDNLVLSDTKINEIDRIFLEKRLPAGKAILFRVFPFARDEVRRTGIEFLHKEPVELMIDNHIIVLGNAEKSFDEDVRSGRIENEYTVYVSAEQKQKLKQVKRKPYFHFLIDISAGKDTCLTDFSKRIEHVLATCKPLSENAQISYVNSYVNHFPLDGNWKENYALQHFEGGFYLDRAIKTTLFNAYKTRFYPIIVVVTDGSPDAALERNFSDFRFAYPESPVFFNLSGNGELQPHSFLQNPGVRLPDSVLFSFDHTVLEYQLPDHSIVYLADNGKPDIVLKEDLFQVAEHEIKERNWMSELTMQAKWMSQVLHPETSDKEWLNLMRYSFMSKIMSPATSYIVVENEAQKVMLRKKQEQVLSGKHSLDLDEQTQRMSEPGLLLLFVLFGLILWLKKRKRIEF